MNLRQLFFAKFDLHVHTMKTEVVAKGAADLGTTKLYEQMREDITLIKGPTGAFPAATFGHIMGGCMLWVQSGSSFLCA